MGKMFHLMNLEVYSFKSRVKEKSKMWLLYYHHGANLFISNEKRVWCIFELCTADKYES